jgi:hypothetical protein
MPQVRTFLKETGHADSYEGLTITWTPGKKPVLYIKDVNGETTETIDLAPVRVYLSTVLSIQSSISI